MTFGLLLSQVTTQITNGRLSSNRKFPFVTRMMAVMASAAMVVREDARPAASSTSPAVDEPLSGQAFDELLQLRNRAPGASIDTLLARERGKTVQTVLRKPPPVNRAVRKSCGAGCHFASYLGSSAILVQVSSETLSALNVLKCRSDGTSPQPFAKPASQPIPAGSRPD